MSLKNKFEGIDLISLIYEIVHEIFLIWISQKQHESHKDIKIEEKKMKKYNILKL